MCGAVAAALWFFYFATPFGYWHGPGTGSYLIGLGSTRFAMAALALSEVFALTLAARRWPAAAILAATIALGYRIALIIKGSAARSAEYSAWPLLAVTALVALGVWGGRRSPAAGWTIALLVVTVGSVAWTPRVMWQPVPEAGTMQGLWSPVWNQLQFSEPGAKVLWVNRLGQPRLRLSNFSFLAYGRWHQHEVREVDWATVDSGAPDLAGAAYAVVPSVDEGISAGVLEALARQFAAHGFVTAESNGRCAVFRREPGRPAGTGPGPGP